MNVPVFLFENGSKVMILFSACINFVWGSVLGA